MEPELNQVLEQEVKLANVISEQILANFKIQGVSLDNINIGNIEHGKLKMKDVGELINQILTSAKEQLSPYQIIRLRWLNAKSFQELIEIETEEQVSL